ncbi:MAG: hypothetical protein SVZ03_06590 [Spirochaetota bacterium]|nr:hypothetical protein [Spirochaetota bacterium]
MKELISGDLVIKVEDNEKSVVISWFGKSRERDPGAVINPYFDEIIDNFDGAELTIDFLKLEYMNSSTVPSIIKLFKLLDTREIPTRVIYDKNSGWQCASFKALDTIAQSLNSVTVEGIVQ